MSASTDFECLVKIQHQHFSFSSSFKTGNIFVLRSTAQSLPNSTKLMISGSTHTVANLRLITHKRCQSSGGQLMMIPHLWRQFVRQSRSSTHWQPNCNVSLVSGTGKNSPAAQFVPFARDRLMRCHRSAAAAVAANVEEEEDRMFYCHCTSVHIANTKRANSLRLAT